ncbi:MAG: D-lyxose/D-mannose family sugar isomerase, partial [Chloroflexi bacterium]
MKRSEINQILRQADDFIRAHGFHLPPFAYWTPDEWRTKGADVAEIVDKRLGWDITDFGSGDYAQIGLFLFTIRNGDLASLQTGRGKLYAEKLLIVDVNQVTPLHFHWVKTEDIINRGGGKLMIELYNATPDEQLDDTPVTVRTDGVVRTVPAGGVIALAPGESITLP